MRNLDIIVTLRCNEKCPNCIEFCNRKADTGLNYADSDMTLEQIDHFIQEVIATGTKPFFNSILITGGEPMLHPAIEEIWRRLSVLLTEGYCEKLNVNTNLTIPPSPVFGGNVINYSLPKNNAAIHRASLLHPLEFGGQQRTRAQCKHYRKDAWVLSYQGYSLCCAGDAYARLFGMSDLFADSLPASANKFPNMDAICVQCPWSNDDLVPLQSAIGSPVSQVYRAEASKNRLGNRITKRYGTAPPAVALPKIAWFCCTYQRPKLLGHLIHCFLQQDYPADRKFMLILDDAGQYDHQSGEGWELISVPRRFSTLGEKRNAAIAMLPPDIDIICPVDDDDQHLPHAMRAISTSMQQGDWAIPSYVYQENAPGSFVKEPYHGHTAAWAYRRDAYYRTQGYSFTTVGEDGGLEVQLQQLNLRIVDPIGFGFEPYALYSRLIPGYHAHAFKDGDYEKLADTDTHKVQLVIAPGYRRVDNKILLV